MLAFQHCVFKTDWKDKIVKYSDQMLISYLVLCYKMPKINITRVGPTRRDVNANVGLKCVRFSIAII